MHQAGSLHLLITPGDFPLITIITSLLRSINSHSGAEITAENIMGKFSPQCFNNFSLPDIGLIFGRLSGDYPSLKYNTYPYI